MVLSLSSAPPIAAQAAVSQESGPFWPGNLLSMNNADFENGVGGWVASSDAKTLTTEDSTSFLHSYALEVDATGPGTSIINMSGGQIGLPGNGSGATALTFRVGAYVNMTSANSHTAEFDLQCYNSSGSSIGWEYGSQVSFSSDGKWHWVEDDITVPANCASVRDSPQVQFTSMHAGGTVYMDEVWFAPKRAALMIGAYTPNASPPSPSAWQTVNTNIGPLQSDKMFLTTGEDFPATWTGLSSLGKQNICAQIEGSYSEPSQWPVCVIAFMQQETELQIQKFLAAMPTSQTVIFIYHQEPEGDSFPTGPGTCDPQATLDSQEFICQFDKEATAIGNAALADHLTENVFTADDSASFKYATGAPATDCSWIVPPNDADFYFEDHYERGWADGSNLSQQSSSPNGVGAQQWNNWLSCADTYTKTLNKPIGLAEYGLCSITPVQNICTSGQSCGTPPDSGASTAYDKATMSADRTYLANQPSGISPQPWSTSPTLLWEYWYANCWAFDDTSNGITEWQSIENQNGGPVGG